jgi:hypothetical protein
MTARRLDAGVMVAALGAALLLASLFVDWYGTENEGYTAWTVFELVDLLLALIALLALSTCVRRAGLAARAPELPVLALGGAALVLVVSQLLNHPPAATELDPKTGAWLALAGAALLLAGAVMSVARISLAVEGRERSAAESAPPPEPAAATDETVKLDEPV